ncbi:MAG: hypothetical protein NT163_07495 [Chlorobiales bacterium]|nr:hypothetical protein [Chlorobiales bacterium]
MSDGNFILKIKKMLTKTVDLGLSINGDSYQLFDDSVISSIISPPYLTLTQRFMSTEMASVCERNEVH